MPPSEAPTIRFRRGFKFHVRHPEIDASEKTYFRVDWVLKERQLVMRGMKSSLPPCCRAGDP